jgi:hypothetical protein
MRRIALLAASLIASVVLMIFLVPARASALTAGGLHNGAINDAAHKNGVQLVRRGGGGFRGGGFRGGGFRGGRAFHGGFRAGGFRGAAFHGGRAFAWRGGVRRAGVWRGGRVHAWRGGRRFWRGPRWGWAVAAAPFYYGYSTCPLVRRTVWTPYGFRVRWVRRCW